MYDITIDNYKDFNNLIWKQLNNSTIQINVSSSSKVALIYVLSDSIPNNLLLPSRALEVLGQFWSVMSFNKGALTTSGLNQPQCLLKLKWRLKPQYSSVFKGGDT